MSHERPATMTVSGALSCLALAVPAGVSLCFCGPHALTPGFAGSRALVWSAIHTAGQRFDPSIATTEMRQSDENRVVLAPLEPLAIVWTGSARAPYAAAGVRGRSHPAARTGDGGLARVSGSGLRGRR